MERISTSPRIHSPEDELVHITSSVQETMDRIYGGQQFNDASSAVQHAVVDKVLSQHVEENLGQTFSNPFSADHKRTESIILNLAPDEDDSHIQELLELVTEVGVLATLKAIEKTASYHIKDDLHRALVAYIHQGYPVKHLSEKDSIRRGLSMTLFELYLPEKSTDAERQKELKHLLSSMEQFYAGMMSVIDASDYDDFFSLEIALPQGRNDILIYAAVPDTKVNIFKNQILAIFPDMKLVESTGDYNIFNKKEQTAATVVQLDKSDMLPVRDYTEFDYDPLNIMLESFANLEFAEGASVQIMIGRDRDTLNDRIKDAIGDIEEGEDPIKALKIRKSILGGISKELGFLFDTRDKEKKEKDEAKKKERATHSDRKLLVEELHKKQKSLMFSCNIRIVAAGNSNAHAQKLLGGFEAAFNQFTNTGGNKFTFQRLSGSAMRELIRKFTFRIFDYKQVIHLNTAELTGILHFHKKNEASSDKLSTSSATTAGASTKTTAGSQGMRPETVVPGKVLLGMNVHQGTKTPIYSSAEDRLRHFYVVGQTGTGKTKLLQNMIVQDIYNGEGVCFIDPHGSDIEEILANIPPHRYDDVIYFDPSDTERPMGLNMLEYDARYPEQKSFVVNEMFSIFDKLFDMKVGGGAMFEQYFRNSTQLVLDDVATGSTLLEISRVLSDENFRRLKLARCKNVIVKQFWEKIATQAGGESSLENIVPYITSKFDPFIGDDIMRPIIAQQKSAFNIREVMDSRKILLVNLSKGRLGEKNANLLGLIFVGKILMAALSRVDAPKEKRPPFYLYIDEFQNVTTNSISQILSEARKYGLSLNVAHQFIKQLDDGIRDAVFGNVGNMATFRVSPEDAEFLEKVHTPVFTTKDISNIDNYNAYVKMLVDGQPQKSFSLATMPPEAGNPNVVQQIKDLSRLKYGRPRAEVEEEIMKKYQSM